MTKVVSKVFERNHNGGELEGTAAESNEAFVSDEEPTLISKPSEQSFDLPAVSIALQGTSKLAHQYEGVTHPIIITVFTRNANVCSGFWGA